jgi:uncharacterized protein
MRLRVACPATFEEAVMTSIPTLSGPSRPAEPDDPGHEDHGLTTRSLKTFFALAFGLTWGIAAIAITFADQLRPIFGEFGYTNPLFILAVYAPGFTGLFLVWRHHGLRGLGSFLRRLTLWRMPWGWWAFLILGIPAVNYAGAALTGTISDPFPFSPWHGVLPALALALAIGPMEEFGWRGVALPLLQRRFAPLWASIVLGVIWVVWHAPAFLLSDTPQAAWAFAPFLIGGVAISVIMTATFNASRGSILTAVLFHFQVNNPIWPDSLPWAALFFLIAAIAVVVWNRDAMLHRGSGVTSVLMPEEPAARSTATGS